jgi:hypothetical protein
MSNNVPVAENCWVVPLAILRAVGDIAMEDSVDELNVAKPEAPS